jgi:hypothetical protein
MRGGASVPMLDRVDHASSQIDSTITTQRQYNNRVGESHRFCGELSIARLEHKNSN